MYREQQLKALLQDRRILIAGYGREGRSAERLILRLVPDSHYTIADGNDQIAAESAKGYDLIIKSPGVPMRVLSADTWPRTTSLTDLFLQVYGDMTIGVTGTKGKSTTASLIHHLLPGSVLAGNIGLPLFDILDDLHEGSLVVAELSCHQLEVLQRSPHIAVLLNLFQEHLDHYENYMGYKMAKMQIALHQSSDDHFFYCTDNAELRSMVDDRAGECRGMMHPYSLDTISDEGRRLLDVSPLPGDHNRSNALVACRVAELASQQSFDDLRNRLATFKGLHHRLELVGTYRGITFYNDSISTIPQATIAALQSLRNVETLILGGYDRGIDYTPLVDYLATDTAVHNIVFVGAAGRRMYGLMTSKEGREVLLCDDYASIVDWCYRHTSPGGVCLLSPAAASYDSFKNFEQRGETFCELVKQYKGLRV